VINKTYIIILGNLFQFPITPFFAKRYQVYPHFYLICYLCLYLSYVLWLISHIASRHLSVFFRDSDEVLEVSVVIILSWWLCNWWWESFFLYRVRAIKLSSLLSGVGRISPLLIDVSRGRRQWYFPDGTVTVSLHTWRLLPCPPRTGAGSDVFVLVKVWYFGSRDMRFWGLN
jgi:hypothetical protein